MQPNRYELPGAAVGSDAVCRCGATALNETGERCANGHLLPGNTSRLIVGERSVQFWRAADDALREMAAQVIADSGHTTDDAPRTLTLIASGMAQAALLRDAAYERLRELGGPLSKHNDRARKAFAVWESAAASVERHAKLLGLKRRPKPIDPLEAVRQAVEAANK